MNKSQNTKIGKSCKSRKLPLILCLWVNLLKIYKILHHLKILTCGQLIFGILFYKPVKNIKVYCIFKNRWGVVCSSKWNEYPNW
jgi:hypothetical protein